MPAGLGIYASDQVNAGQTPDYDDLLVRLEAPNYQLSSWIPRGRKPEQIESIHYLLSPETANHRGRPEGEDVTSFGKSTPTEFKARGQFFGGKDASWKVSDQAEVFKVLGRDGKQEVAYQKAKAMERLKKGNELRLASSIDATAEGVSGAEYNGTAGVWAYARTDGSGYHAIPSGFRPTSNMVVSGGNLTGFTYSVLDTALVDLNALRKRKVTLTGFVAPKMKRAFPAFLNYVPNVGGHTPVKTVNRDGSDGSAIYTPVERLEHDFATIDLVSYHWHLYSAGTDGTPSAQDGAGNYSGCFLDRETWEIGMYRPTYHKDLPDLGGGQRGAWFNALMLRNLMPCGNLFFQYAAA